MGQKLQRNKELCWKSTCLVKKRDRQKGLGTGNSVDFYWGEKLSEEGSSIGGWSTYLAEKGKGPHPSPFGSSLNLIMFSLSIVTQKPRVLLTSTQDKVPTAYSESHGSQR